MNSNRGEKNLKFVKPRSGKPGSYLTEIALKYRRIRRFAGHTKEAAKAYLAKLRIAAREGRLNELIRLSRPVLDTGHQEGIMPDR